MAILSRPRLTGAQRFDLEDWETLLSALRSDSHFFVKRFLSSKSYILKGFTVDSSFIGQNSAQISLTNATLINGDSSTDFSWYTAETGASPLSVPAASLEVGRNYIELALNEENGTPLPRVFWDPTARGGEGEEFSETTDTVTDLAVSVVINQSGFNSGNPDRIPVCIIDVDGSDLIKGIQDRRELFFRLGTPTTPDANYAWGSQEEPSVTLTFPSPASTSFVAEETVTFTSGATAKVSVGGTNNVKVNRLSNVNILPGDIATGATSGAVAEVSSYYEAFTGADKDIGDFRAVINALQTEVKKLKGTDFWFEAGPVTSLATLLKVVNAVVAPVSSGAKFVWSGTNLSISDSASVGQADADVIAAIRLPGYSQDLELTREDGTGGSSTIAIPDGSLLYVELPTSGDRVYSGTGSGTTNYRVVALADFVPTDTAFILAYREGSRLLVKGLGELQTGESAEIGDGVSKETLSFIGADNEADSTPAYTSDIRGVAAENLTARVGKLTDAVGDSQEDRSAFLRSDADVTWSGIELSFTEDLVLEIINTKSGTATAHSIAAANSPIAIADDEVIWVSVDRTQASEVLTLKRTTVDAIPAQTQANKDVFILFKRIDTGLGEKILYLPFSKQILTEGQTSRLGAGGGSGSGDFLELENRLMEQFQESSYRYMTSSIFSKDKEELVDTAESSGAYSVAQKVYELDAGENLVTKDLIDPAFLSNAHKTATAQLTVFSDDDLSDVAFSFETGKNFYDNTGTGLDNYPLCGVVQADGKIVLGGNFTDFDGNSVLKIVRLNRDGGYDSSFVDPGLLNGPIYAMGIQSDGKIIVCGQNLAFGADSGRIYRLNTDGSVDLTFIAGRGTGFNTSMTGCQLRIDANDKILVLGNFTTFDGVATGRFIRLNSDGSKDTAFMTNFGSGWNSDFAAISDILVQSDGKIVIAGGSAQFDGALDKYGYVVRLNDDGTEDTAFYTNMGVGGAADVGFNGGSRVAQQSDGKLVFFGNFTTFKNVARGGIVRLNEDGTEDTAFQDSVGTGFNSVITRANVSVDTADRIYAAGYFTSFDGTTRNRFIRLSADGADDVEFNDALGTAFDAAVLCLVMQPDNRPIVGGLFTTLDGVARNRLVRFNSDGSEEVEVISSVEMEKVGENSYIGTSTLDAQAYNSLRLRVTGGAASAQLKGFGVLYNEDETSVETVPDDYKRLIDDNHLASTDATISRGVAGRGIILMRPDGTLREITIDNSDNIVIKEV